MSVSERFINGLKSYNLTYEEVKEWDYCGGNNGTHLKYYKKKYQNKQLPEFKNNCICGHKLKNNCYITNHNIILILGSCCIKRFIDKGLKRTCLTCDKPYKGKYRCCIDCRKTRCWTCCANSYFKFCKNCL